LNDRSKTRWGLLAALTAVCAGGWGAACSSGGNNTKAGLQKTDGSVTSTASGAASTTKSSSTSTSSTTSGSGQGGAAGAGGEGGASAHPDFASCATSQEEGVLTPANLLFVIDNSGSMNCNAPETGQTSAACEVTPQKEFPDLPSKWEIVRATLSTAVGGLVGRNNVSAGVVIFPRPGDENTCAVSSEPDVPIATLDANQKSAIDEFLGSVEPEGRTPIAGSVITSYDYLATALRAEELSGNTFVVLLTDGQDTCDGEQRPELIEAFVSTHVPLIHDRPSPTASFV
jgi:hypothetical protein